jgi:glycosyltransferase involved in cell wall biosynthesis
LKSKILKVAWICHFSNKEIRSRLSLSDRPAIKWLKKLLKRPSSYNNDFAPWVSNLIIEFEKREDVELHVIAPINKLKESTYEITINRIHYHFYRSSFPYIYVPYHEIDHKVKINRFYVKRFINNIRPDIVNLIGTENPYYSMTVLDIKDIPIYVSVQTVYSNPARKLYSDNCLKYNWDTELKIHKKEKYFGCAGRMHHDLILGNNPNAIIYKMFFPIEKPSIIKEITKIYDFVFFAGISKKKGIEDLIEALIIVKRYKQNVTLNIVGQCSSEYKHFLMQIIIKNGLESNISFTDYFPIHSEMHEHVMKSHHAVMPVKLDIIPSSVIEAILLNLTVVTYKTTGTPYLNKDGDAVLLVDMGNIEMLAQQMIKLLDSQTLSQKLRENARKIVDKEFNNSKSAERLIANYHSVLDHYYKNIPIPSDQLFNINEFPKY